MPYYLKLILVLVQLLLVQSNDLNPNDFYQRRLTTRNQRGALHTSDQISVGERFPMLDSSTFFKQNYFKTQTTTPIATLYRASNFDSNYHLVPSVDLEKIARISAWMAAEGRRNQEENCYYTPGWKKCGDPSQRWCCPFDKSCGTFSKRCQLPFDELQVIYITVGVGVGIPLVLIGVAICYIFCEDRRVSLQIDRSIRRQHTGNLNSVLSEPENLIENIDLKNSMVSIEFQPSNNVNYNDGEAATLVGQQTSNFPPAYDDVIQQSLITILMDQLSLLPPTYEDFLGQNN